MDKNIIKKILELIKPHKKQLTPGINMEEIYKDELARLSPEEIEQFRPMAGKTPFFEFEFSDSPKMLVPAFDAYTSFTESFVRKVFENAEMFNALTHFVQQGSDKQDKSFSVMRYRNSSFFELHCLPSFLLRAGHDLYDKKEGTVSSEVKARIKKLEKMLSIDKLLKTKIKYFSTYIEGEEFIATKKELLALLLESEKSFDSRFTEDKTEYNYKLLTALKEFLCQGGENPEILENYAFLSEHVKRFEHIYDEKLPELRNKMKVRSKKTAYSDRINVNPKLRSAIYKDMPQGMSDVEKALYIYEKLCQILVYDSKFFVHGEGKQVEEHSDLMQIGMVTPENNSIVCYEFTYIYAKILEENGINHEIRFGTGDKRSALSAKTESDRDAYGGVTHTFCVVKADDIIFTADSTTTSFGGDLINAKVGEELIGLTVLSAEREKVQKFDVALQKVQRLLNEQQEIASQAVLLQTYRTLTSEKTLDKKIDFDEKVIFLRKLLASAEKTNGVENYYYLSRINENFIWSRIFYGSSC